MNNMDNALRRQVYSLPDLIAQQYEDLEPKTRKVLSTPEIFSIQRIVLTGCGDSYAAAMATKHAFEMLTNIPTEVVTALELSRLYQKKQIGFAPHNPLVIAVSNSGGVARIGEAVERMNTYGAFTLGITGNPDGVLAQKSSRVLPLNIPSFESAPGTRSYLVSVMALLLMAIRIGEVRGVRTMDASMDMRFDMLEQGKQLAAMLPAMDEKVAAVATKWKDFDAFDYVGGGFDYATAFYGHAKIMEAVGKYAMHINTEEWLHLNFFMRKSTEIGTVLVANSTNPCDSRSQEVEGYMQTLGRPLMVVTDKTDGVDTEQTTYCTVPATRYPITMPLTHFAPLALLAGYLQVLVGEEDGRGCKDQWSFAQGGKAVKESKIVID